MPRPAASQPSFSFSGQRVARTHASLFCLPPEGVMQQSTDDRAFLSVLMVSRKMCSEAFHTSESPPSHLLRSIRCT